MLTTISPEVSEELGKVIAFATKANAVDQLLDRLDYLRHYGTQDEDNPREIRCTLFSDFAPHSFRFVIEQRPAGDQDYKLWFSGGLIYSGPESPASGCAQSLTVSLDQDQVTGEKHLWSVHT